MAEELGRDFEDIDGGAQLMKTADENNDCDDCEGHAKGTINSVESSVLGSRNTQTTLLVTYGQSAAIVQEDKSDQAEHDHNRCK